MEKVLIFAEKPSQARAYAEAFEIAKKEETHIILKPCSTFKNGAIITWGIGHLVELKDPADYKEEWAKWKYEDLPILPDQFDWKVKKKVKEQFNAVKKLLAEADIWINAADLDREGSNIFYSTCKMAHPQFKPIKRLWINSLEADEIIKGFNNLKDNEKDLLMYKEARSRQIADWITGISGTRIFTIALQEKGVKVTLPIGRCISPLVYMIYEHQMKIENFKSEPFFELLSEFEVNKEEKYEGKAKYKVTKIEEIYALLKQANINKNSPGMIKSVEKELKQSLTPKLHTLSTLQTKANKKWKYSPSKTLKLMQSLYEKKLLSYPRTDCHFITENEFAYLVKNLEGYKSLVEQDFEANILPNKRYVDGKSVAEHYAIIPTKKIPGKEQIQALPIEEQNIYFEILNTTLSMFHRPYQYEQTKIITDVNGIDFESVGKVELDKGWKALFSDDVEADKGKVDNNLPNVTEGTKVNSNIFIKEGKTTPPKPLTEGQLITLMKTAGKHLEDPKDVELLKEIEGIGTEATRSNLIESIKDHEYIIVNKNIVSITDKTRILCQAIEGTLLASAEMTAKWESYLRTIGDGIGSEGVFIQNVVKFMRHLKDTVPTKLNSTNVKAAIQQKQENETLGTCPSCKKGLIVDRKTFVSCDKYKEGCKFSINKVLLEKKLTNKQISDLISKGVTSEIKGFKSKQGKPFNAKLRFKEGKISFDFNK